MQLGLLRMTNARITYRILLTGECLENENIHWIEWQPDLQTLTLYSVEATLVALTPSDQEPFLVASIYAPPGPNYRNLGADLDGIFNIFKSAFLAGDYNAKHTSWGCNYSDPRGQFPLGIAKAFRKKTSPISALNGPTGIALSDTNKTEVIAHSLEKQFHLNDIHNPRKDEIITSVVDAYMDSNINNTDIIPHSPI
ncbi:hypothetical protein TNCV_4737391 [Trichonephila clavipes]|nr:hypothetical protein TNCV_4737391 [Trichonephila clavipes]